MRLNKRRPIPVPQPPTEYVLVLEMPELLHLYALSFLREGGDKFPTDGRWVDVLGRTFPEVQAQYEQWRENGYLRFFPLFVESRER